MAMKCKMPNCRSYTNSESGLCGFHEEKAIELQERLDAEQRTPEEETRDKERLRLMHAQTFEKFTARQEEDENYERISKMVREAVEATLGEEVSREVFDSLRQAQEEVKRVRLRREKRDELWHALQRGFENEKRKREAKQREWEERKRRWQENAAPLSRKIAVVEQEACSSTFPSQLLSLPSQISGEGMQSGMGCCSVVNFHVSDHVPPPPLVVPPRTRQ